MQQEQMSLESAEEPTALSLLKERAERLGFTCISTHWQGPYALYAFVCPAGHALQRTAKGWLYGGRPAPCSDCARVATFKRLQTLASWKGGVCLETEFLGAQAHHRMRCAKGHEWQAEGRKLLAGNWCPICTGSALATRRTARRVNAVRKLAVVSTASTSQE